MFRSFSPPSSSLLEEENDIVVAEKGDSDNDSEIIGPVKKRNSRNPFLEDEDQETNSLGEDEKLFQRLKNTKVSLMPTTELLNIICYMKASLQLDIIRILFHNICSLPITFQKFMKDPNPEREAILQNIVNCDHLQMLPTKIETPQNDETRLSFSPKFPPVAGPSFDNQSKVLEDDDLANEDLDFLDEDFDMPEPDVSKDTTTYLPSNAFVEDKETENCDKYINTSSVRFIGCNLYVVNK